MHHRRNKRKTRDFWPRVRTIHNNLQGPPLRGGERWVAALCCVGPNFKYRPTGMLDKRRLRCTPKTQWLVFLQTLSNPLESKYN